MVVNVEGSSLAKGNNGLELLNYIPTVRLDYKGEIAVMGKKGVLIYIDNIPQYNLSNDFLKSMRAETIEKVEVYSNPPAKFDASGSAIINIITKKDKMFSTLSEEVTTPIFPTNDINGLKYTSSYTTLTLFNSFGKFKTRTIVSPNLDNSGFSKSLEKLVYNTTGTMRENQYSQNAHSPSIRLGIAADYDINKNDAFILDYSYLQRRSELNNSNNYLYYNETSTIDSSYSLTSNSIAKVNSSKLYIGYTHKVNTSGKQLSLGYQNIIYNHDDQYNYLNSINGEVQNSYTTPINSQKVNAGNLNIKLPIKNGYNLEIGTKYTNVTYSSKYNYYNISYNNIAIEDSSFRNIYFYKEGILGTFFSLQKNFNKLQTSIGLRNEYTKSSGNTDGVIIEKSYNNIFPSVFLQYTITDEKQIGVSYTKRVQRPSYNEFNSKGIPFFNSLLNILEGNTNLSPQFTHALEANYTYKDWYIAFSLNRTDKRRVTLPVSIEGYSIISKVFNLSYSENFTFSINKPFQITNWWQTSNSVNFYIHQSKLLDNTLIKGNYWDISSQQTFILSKTARIEAYLMYFSGEIEQYTKSGNMKTIDISYKNTFLKNRLEMTLGLSDILGFNKFITISNTPLIYEYTKSIINQRKLKVSLIYKFPTSIKFQKKRGTTNDFGEIRAN
ncbi:MAG: outer membrane beta-barrel family protein [Siphonobacter sp.]